MMLFQLCCLNLLCRQHFLKTEVSKSVEPNALSLPALFICSVTEPVTVPWVFSLLPWQKCSLWLLDTVLFSVTSMHHYTSQYDSIKDRVVLHGVTNGGLQLNTVYLLKYYYNLLVLQVFLVLNSTFTPLNITLDIPCYLLQCVSYFLLCRFEMQNHLLQHSKKVVVLTPAADPFL